MNSLEYYKSLVTESEVINALIKESKVKDGEVEKPRVRPNLQFFQRTVSNLVSSNNRITVNQEKIRAKEKEKNTFYRPQRNIEKRKLPIEYINEILSNKIEFVKSSEGPVNDTCRNLENNDVKKITASPSQRQKKTVICKKSPFQQIREILTNNKTQQIPQISSDDFSKEKKCSRFRRKLCPNDSIEKSRDSPDIQIINETDSCSSSDTTYFLKTKKSKKRRYSSSSYSSTDSESVSKSKKYQKPETSIINLSSTSSSSCTGSDSDSCVIIEGPSCNT